MSFVFKSQFFLHPSEPVKSSRSRPPSDESSDDIESEEPSSEDSASKKSRGRKPKKADDTKSVTSKSKKSKSETQHGDAMHDTSSHHTSSQTNARSSSAGHAETYAGNAHANSENMNYDGLQDGHDSFGTQNFENNSDQFADGNDYNEEYEQGDYDGQLAPNQVILTLSYSLVAQIRQVARLEGVNPEDILIELIAEGVTKRAFQEANRATPSHLMTRTGYVPPDANGNVQQPTLSHHSNQNQRGQQGNSNQRRFNQGYNQRNGQGGGYNQNRFNNRNNQNRNNQSGGQGYRSKNKDQKR